MSLTFRKSSYSDSHENCVEVAPLPHPGTALRDSQHPDAEHLTFGPTEWTAFLHAVKQHTL